MGVSHENHQSGKSLRSNEGQTRARREAYVPMISDEKVARHIVELMDKCSDAVLDSIRDVNEKCPPDEAERYKKAAAFLAGYMYTEIVAPLHSKHPSLEPPELRESDSQSDKR